MTLILHSERRPATGGLGASGALNSLGRPDMDFWSLYVREALQNCWDARRGDGPVRVAFEVRTLTGEERAFLDDHVLVQLPDDGRPEWWEQLVTGSTVVTVTDTGTTGMGGPVRADVADPEVHDFADFVWNIGQPPDKQDGGGTYGYGKSVHYLASGAHTIVVHTVCDTDDVRESRLLVCSWGTEFAAEISGEPVPHTGRHWWGAPSDDPDVPVTPVIGDEADRIATGLGMPTLGEGTGTSVMVLAANVEDHPAWGDAVADAATWYCWPKLVDIGSGTEMSVDVVVDGESVDLPDPETHPEISVLIDCLRGEGEETTTIQLPRPRTITGQLGLKRHMVREPSESPARPFVGPMRHVALMRGPLLVVEYLEGPEPPAPFAGWGGVFVAQGEHDRAFALAEPPAHDAWVARSVGDKKMRRIVNVTLKRIGDAVREFASPKSPDQAGEGRGLGALADRLGDLLPVEGPGAVRPLGNGPRGGGSRPGSRAFLRDHLFEPADGGLVLTAAVAVTLGDGKAGALLSMDVSVATSDGSALEREAPLGAPLPELRGWVDPTGNWSGTPTVKIEGDREQTWEARVWVPADTAVVLRPKLTETGRG